MPLVIGFYLPFLIPDTAVSPLVIGSYMLSIFISECIVIYLARSTTYVDAAEERHDQICRPSQKSILTGRYRRRDVHMPHYYDESPEAPHDRKQLSTRIGTLDLQFQTDSAVFSRSQLDFGTRLLIESVLEDYRSQDQSPHGRLLDLGCGYGPVGIAFKRLFPPLDVVMTDVNARAIQLARENASTNKVRYVDIRHGDGFAIIGKEERFDIILTNPPIRAGKKTVYAFFDGACEHLAPGGRLYVVIQNKQGAPSARQHLLETFGNCDDIERKAGYHIFRCTRQADQGNAG